MTRDPIEPLIPPEVAYYYPEWHWGRHDHGWVMSLLLFFDEIALLVPEYKRFEPATLDPELAGALQDLGMLRIIEPEWFVDSELTSLLAEAMVTIIETGAFDNLSRRDRFAELSMSRAGYSGERQVADKVVELLRQRKLARDTADGMSIPMHPTVRSTYLVLLAQLARRAGDRHGLDLHPATNRPEAHAVVARTLNLSPLPSRGRVVDFDLEAVSIDLEGVPLDEVLSYRSDHRDEHRTYMKSLRRFCQEVSDAESEADRLRLFRDRKAELQEAAESLRRRSWKAFKQPKNALSFGLGLVGAGITLAGGGIPAAGVTAASQLLRLLPDRAESSIYSYLFSAQRQFG